MFKLHFGMTGLALAASLAAGSVGALADGEPQRSIKDAPPPPVSWTGSYVGGNVGYHGANIGNTQAMGADAASSIVLSNCLPSNLGDPANTLWCNKGRLNGANGEGAILGLHAGYNWQSSSLVYGVEVDFQGSTAGATKSFSNTTAFPGFPATVVGTTNVAWLGTVRARLGALISPTFLAYVTGGFAYGGVSRDWGAFSPNGGLNSFGRAKSTETGWTAGGGLEWAIGNRVTVGAEYLYVNLDGGSSFRSVAPTGAIQPQNVNVFTPNDIDNHIARLKVNFKL